MESERKIARALARQAGVISRAQAHKAGLSPRGIDRRIESAEWIRVLPGVYRHAAVAPTWYQLVVATYLWAGPCAAVSHRAAVVFLKLRGIDDAPVELTLPSWRKTPSPKIVLHTSDAIPAKDLVKIGCLSVTNATRTLIDLGSVVDQEALENVLDDAFLKGRTSIDRVQRRLSELGVPGRRGPGALRGVLAERDPASQPTESVMEVKFRRFSRRFSLPTPVSQLRVPLPNGQVARSDFAYPDQKIAIECDSFGFHADKGTFDYDRERQNLLVTLGWQVLRFTWRDLTRRPEWVALLIKDALRIAQLPLSTIGGV